MRIIRYVKNNFYYFKLFDFKIKNEKYPLIYNMNFDTLVTKLNKYNITSQLINYYDLSKDYKYYEFYINNFYNFYNLLKKIIMLFFILKLIILISRPLVSVK